MYDKRTISKTVDNLKVILKELETSMELGDKSILIPAVVYTVNVENDDVFGNYHALSTLGYEPEEIDKKERKLFEHLVHDSDKAKLDELVTFITEKKGDSWAGTIRLKKSKDNYHTFSISAIPYHTNEAGAVTKIAVIATDLTYFVDADRQFKDLIGDQFVYSISKREKQIIKMIVAGYKNAEIAEAIDIRLPTVETHRKNIYRKLKLKNTADLISFATRNGLADGIEKVR
jgi:DNA-binding CsgD family transcriptional regulator